jgi:hypothetical protein
VVTAKKFFRIYRAISSTCRVCPDRHAVVKFSGVMPDGSLHTSGKLVRITDAKNNI